MKTYLFDTFNRYKRFSEELDAKTILCNRSWWVFNDNGDKEVYIFQTDGTLIIAVSGKVTNATWQYIPANKSLIITGNNQSYMVHPAFYDQMIFVLQVDGTNDYAFLIDENNLPSTKMRSLTDLKNHFAEIEKQALLAEEEKRQAELAALKQKELKAEEERQRQAKEAEKNRLMTALREKYLVIRMLDLSTHETFILFVLLFWVISLAIVINPNLDAIITSTVYNSSLICLVMLSIILILSIIGYIYKDKIYKIYLKKYQKK